jgi:hypothetical protein
MSSTLLGLQKTWDRLDAHLQSSAVKLRLLLDDRRATKIVLNDLEANITATEAEQDGESKVKEDELVEEMVDEEIRHVR